MRITLRVHVYVVSKTKKNQMNKKKIGVFYRSNGVEEYLQHQIILPLHVLMYFIYQMEVYIDEKKFQKRLFSHLQKHRIDKHVAEHI